MAKANTTKTNKTNTTTKTAKGEKVQIMTYPQALALTNAIFHSNKTKAELSTMIDGLLPKGSKGGMKPEAKQAWLEKAGQEHCTYGQCKMFAFSLLQAKAPYDKVSALISDYDKTNGYTRTPKEAVAKGNETAKKNAPKGKKEPKQAKANA